MKEIKAIIRPFKLTQVITELKKIQGLPGVTVSQIKGFGKSRAQDAQEKIVDEMIEYAEKVKIEVVVKDDMVHEVVSVIQQNAFTGNTGDGKIFVYDVNDVIKIRTNESGAQAI